MARRTIYQPAGLSLGTGEMAQLQASQKGHLKVSGGDGVVLDFTPVLDTGIYADNDVLFISQILTGVSDMEGGVVELVSGVCFDGDDQGTEVEIFFTTNSITPGTINGAVAAADTVFDDIVGRLHFITFNDLINSQQAILPLAAPVNQIMQCAAGSKDLYVFGVVRSGTPTYTAAGMKFKFGFKRL
jgi:hypothetical protein